MKKFYALLLTAFCVSLHSTAQVPKILARTNADSCIEHKFKYNTYVPNILLGKIEHQFGDGTRDTSSLTFEIFSQSTMALFNHSYAAPGTYTAKAVLLYNNARVDSVTQHFFAGNCKAFTGHVYKDENSNCVMGEDDRPILSTLSIGVDSAGVRIDTVTAFGNWAFMRPWNVGAGQYTFKMLNIAGDYNSSCQANNTRSMFYGGYGSPLPPPVNFGYSCSSTGGSTDAIASGQGQLRATTAVNSGVVARVTNMGCLTGSGTFSVKVSPKYSIVSTSLITPAPLSVVGNTVTWSYSALAHGTLKNASVAVLPATAISLGDTAQNIFTAMPSNPDANTANNMMIRIDTVRNSWDPNDKTPSPAGDITAGTTLTYHINFENLGNDTAFNVHVLDTLSSTLDASTFQLLSASAAVRVFELSSQGGSRVLKFDFPNIRLADKTSPAHNKGFVRFSVKVKSALAHGTEIPNRAGIYFDSNPAIMTNTAMNKIGFPQTVSVLSSAPAYRVHPNPTAGTLHVSLQSNAFQTASLMNATGQVVRQWAVQAGENIFDMADLPAGLYLMNLSGLEGTATEKIEKR